MFYVNYRGENAVGVVDTEDLVEEYYTYGSINDFQNRGLVILPQEAQTYLFWHMCLYLDLVSRIQNSNKSAISSISAVLAFAEGRSKNMSKFEMKLLSTSQFTNYVSSIKEIRTKFHHTSFGYHDIPSSTYASFSKLIKIAESKKDIPWFDKADTYEREDGVLGSHAWDSLLEELDKLEDEFCEKFRFQKDLLHEWFVSAYDLNSAG